MAFLSLTGALDPAIYVLLLAVSSLLVPWGTAGEYSMLADVGGPDGRLAANSIANAQVALFTIIGPIVAGVLLSVVEPGWLLALDAASFAVLAVTVWTILGATSRPDADREPAATASGFRLLRRRDLLSLTVVTWVFYFLYGPVEVALPVYVGLELDAPPQLLGAYWASFAIGALVATLVTGALRVRNMRGTAIAIVAGWGACLLPFAFAPVPVTLLSFAIGGLIFGPFVPLTFALFQSATPASDLPAVLAARSTVVLLSTPLGIALGGPLVGVLGGAGTLAASGVATLALAGIALVVWPHGSPSGHPEPVSPERAA
jgi:hypothetical protein